MRSGKLEALEKSNSDLNYSRTFDVDLVIVLNNLVNRDNEAKQTLNVIKNNNMKGSVNNPFLSLIRCEHIADYSYC